MASFATVAQHTRNNRSRNRSRVGGFQVSNNPANAYEKALAEDAEREKLKVGMEALAKNQKRIEMSNGKKATYDSFNKYLDDNNLGHLNTLLEENPTVKSIWGGDKDLVRLSKLDEFQTNRVATALAQSNLSRKKAEATEYNFENIDTNSLAQQYVEAIYSDGTTNTINLRDLMSASGYVGQMTAEQQKQFQNWVSIHTGAKAAATRQGVLESQAREANAEATIEESKAAVAPEKAWGDMINSVSQGQSAQMKMQALKKMKESFGELGVLGRAGIDAQTILDLEELSGKEEFTQEDEVRYEELVSRMKSPATKKRMDTVVAERGLQGFMEKPVDADPTPEEEGYLTTLRDAKEWTSGQKEFLTEDLPSFTPLFKNMVELQESNVGLIDQYKTSLENFFTTTGAENLTSKAAKDQFLNILRNSFFGAALSANEIKAFREAYGDNREQLVPSLKKLKVAMDSIKGKLDSAENFNEEVFKADYGQDAEAFSEAYSRINDRIKVFDLLDKEEGEITIEQAISIVEQEKVKEDIFSRIPKRNSKTNSTRGM